MSCYGVRLGLRTDDPELLAPLRACLPPGWRPTEAPQVDLLYSLRSGAPAPAGGTKDAALTGRRPGTRRFYLAYSEHLRIARSLDLQEALDALEADISLFVAERAPRRIFVHAGVVGWRGRAILIPGKSHAGKTTLVAELVRAGAEYYSDEYAVLDARGWVHPFPRPLSIRQGLDERPRRTPPEALGGVSGSRPLRIGLVVSTEYREGAAWNPEALSSGQAVLALLAHTVPARRRPTTSLRFLRQAIAGAVSLRGFRGEAADFAAELLRRAEEEVARA